MTSKKNYDNAVSNVPLSMPASPRNFEDYKNLNEKIFDYLIKGNRTASLPIRLGIFLIGLLLILPFLGTSLNVLFGHHLEALPYLFILIFFAIPGAVMVYRFFK